MNNEMEVIRESFTRSLARRLLGQRHPLTVKVFKWEDENRRGGITRGRNALKRELRSARKVDRLALIRYWRTVLGVTYHVPKVKRVPAYVYE